jgi:long-chain fatty acid transport protein
MKFLKKSATAALVALGSLALSYPAWATNGYFTHGVGAESKGMAGTGIGSNGFSGPIIAASNPALAVFADDSWEAGLSIFSPRRSYEALGPGAGGQQGTFSVTPGKIDSSSEYFPIPYVARKWGLDDDRAVSFVFYGRGGMNTDWDSSTASATSLFCDPTGQAAITGPGPFCAGDAGVDLMQAFISVTYSGMQSDRFAWGLGPVVAIQAFEARGIASFMPITKTFYDGILENGVPAMATNLTNNGHDMSFGIGFTGGLWFGLSDNVGLGLSYQSQIGMSKFDDYSDLFAESGGFDIPPSVKFGLSFGGEGALRVNFDVEHIMYSEVDSVGNPMMNILGCPTTASPQNPNPSDPESCLGGGRGAGFGWDDMTTYKVGLEYAFSESNTFRIGYSTGEQPIQSADVLFNILAPGAMEEHITVGWTHRNRSGSAWTASFMYAPENSVVGPNFFDPFQQIELSMDQIEFELAYRF